MPLRLATVVAGTGPRIVLVHGFTQSARSWDRVRPALPTGHEIVAVDLPGHGGSTPVRVADLSEAAALLGEAGGEATYVGYSLGGRTSLTLALARPDLVRALVLVGATAGIEDDDERARRRERDEALARRLEVGGDEGLGAFLDAWLAGPLFAHLSPAQADLAARRVNSAAGLASSLRSCGTGTQTPSWHRLGELAMPVLVCAGARDTRFASLATRLAAAIGPNARAASVPDAGHAACFERPAAFAALLAAFLPAGH